MGNITIEGILLLVLFFVPGFIYLKIYRLLFPETKTDFSKDFYEAIGISLIIGICFSWPIYILYNAKWHLNHTIPFFLIIIFIIVIVPIICAIFYRWLTGKSWFSKLLIHPTKAAWDSLFAMKEAYWVIVTLKNGRKIGGKYQKKSFSSTYPCPHDIYIEELWRLGLNDEFIEIEAGGRTRGILICENEISTIEFY